MVLKSLKATRPSWVWLLAALVLAGGFKAGLQITGSVPFNADEAVVALMARHILQGENPIFFYGQAYWGSLDAWLVSIGFRIFGDQLWVLRLVQGLLYTCTLITTAWIGRLVFNNHRVGLLAVWLLVIPTVTVSMYTTVGLGYGEVLLLGNLILLIGLKIGGQLQSSRMPAWYYWLSLGFVSGLGFWALGLTLVYTVSIAIYLIAALYRFHKAFKLRWPNWWPTVAATLGGAFLGSLPWWIYAFEQGFGRLLEELAGGGIAGVEGLPWFAQIGQHILNFIVFGSTAIFGLRPPWTFDLLGLPLVPFVVAFWLAVITSAAKEVRRGDRKPEKLVLLGIPGILIFAFVFSPFGADPSGRYFLPLATPLALFAGKLISDLKVVYGNIVLGMIALILIHNLWANVDGMLRFPPGITARFDVVTRVNQRTIYDLISFLKQKQETRGYTNYWVAYTLAFLSKEQMIFIPRLPYRTDFAFTLRDDRYVPYDAIVTSSPRAAYITTNFPDLDQYLRDGFRDLGVLWKEAQIGDFHVFYDLSVHVAPDQIGLGFDSPP